MARLMASQKKNGNRFKFGVQVPRSVKQAYELDRINGNNLWAEAMKKEINQLMEYDTFHVLDSGEVPTLKNKGYTFVPMHMCFDVKFDLRRKAQLVAGGHLTAPPEEDVYSGVVSIESVRLALFLAGLNDMQVCAADIGNAYLHAKTKEHIYTKAGPEFGSELEGKYLLIDKGLYGLKTSAARFHEQLAATLIQLGWKPSYADYDLWIKDCGTHYEYITSFVDDLLIVSKDPMSIINELAKVYPLKGVGSPEYYLGGDVFTQRDPNSVVLLATSAKTYIKNIVDKIEKLFEVTLKGYETPMDVKYHPELDDSELLDGDDVSKYQMLTGALNWIVTLGRYDVHYVASTMARYNMLPRQGHFSAMLGIFGYLKSYHKYMTIYDHHLPEGHDYIPTVYDWFQFYPDAVQGEELPYNMPIPKGNPVKLSGYFDADHASDLETRCSVTGVLLLVNQTPVKCYSK
jgi:hypothetical protein